MTAAPLPFRPRREPTKQQAFVAAVWAVFDEVEAPRPPAGLVNRWLRVVFDGDAELARRAFDEAASRGYLAMGVGYVYKCLRSLREEALAAASAPTPRPAGRAGGCDSLRIEAEELDRAMSGRPPLVAGQFDVSGRFRRTESGDWERIS